MQAQDLNMADNRNKDIYEEFELNLVNHFSPFSSVITLDGFRAGAKWIIHSLAAAQWNIHGGGLDEEEAGVLPNHKISSKWLRRAYVVTPAGCCYTKLNFLASLSNIVYLNLMSCCIVLYVALVD